MAAPVRVPLDLVLRRVIAAHALGGRAATIDAAVRAAGGIYGANPTAHRSLAARVDGYAPAALTRAETEDRSLARVPAMRGSVYLLPADLVPAGLTLSQRKDMRWYTGGLGLDEAAYVALADAIEQAAAVGRGRTTAEIRTALGSRAPASLVLTAVVRRMGSEGRVVRAGVAGGIGSQAWRYVRGRDWLPALAAGLPDRATALRALVPLWLAANGPLAPADLGWWASLPVGEAAGVLDAIGAIPVAVDGLAADLRALPADVAVLVEAAGPLADPDEVHLLPYWDAWLMASRDRARYLAPGHAPFVVDRDGNVTNVTLRGGRVVGTWDLDGERLLHADFEPLPEAVIMEAAQAQAQVAPIRDLAPAVARPLDAIGRSSFMRPLRAR